MKIKLQSKPSSQNQPVTLELTPEQWAQIESSLAAGQKLEAIKQARQWAKVDLRTAKEAVDAYQDKLHEMDPQKYPASGSGSGCGVSAAIFALMVGSAGLWLTMA